MKTALVGGASKGLGYGCAQVLAQKGCRMIVCARTRAGVEEAVDSLNRTTSAGVIGIPCDWSKREDIAALAEELRRRALDVDILVNNVGGPAPGTVMEITETGWEEGLDLLFRSTVRLYSLVLPGMRRRKWGRIVNILSTVAVEPVPMLAISSVLRAALASYSKLVALEVAPDGVTVNSLMPGGFRTARNEALLVESARRLGVAVEARRQQIEAGIPIRRQMDPVELGRLVGFLTSDDAGGITGTLIPIDGGQQKSI